MLKMLCESTGKLLRCPSDQIGNLAIAYLDNAKLTVGVSVLYASTMKR